MSHVAKDLGDNNDAFESARLCKSARQLTPLHETY